MRFVARVFWPAYLAACVAEMAFFSLIDPNDLWLRSDSEGLSAIGVYSLGFILFVAVGVTSSLLTCYLTRSAAQVNRRPPAAEAAIVE